MQICLTVVQWCKVVEMHQIYLAVAYMNQFCLQGKSVRNQWMGWGLIIQLSFINNSYFSKQDRRQKKIIRSKTINFINFSIAQKEHRSQSQPKRDLIGLKK